MKNTNDMPRIFNDVAPSAKNPMAMEIKRRGEKGKYLRDRVVEPYKFSTGKWV